MAVNGIEMSLRICAEIARAGSKMKWARDLALINQDRLVPERVDCVIRAIRAMPPSPILAEPPMHDADEAVTGAAAVCLAMGVPCRIVGARYGHSWTCWLGYRDAMGSWHTVDALTGKNVEVPKPDEQITVACGEEETTMEDDRREESLADGVQLVVHDQHRHYIERIVTLTAPDPVHVNNHIQVSVGSSVSTYEPKPGSPTIQFVQQPWWTRRQWELAKRLGDQAWDEYERRFPNG